MRMRGGRTKSNHVRWSGADKFDLGDQMYILDDLWSGWEDKKKYVGKSLERIQFEVGDIKEWVKEKNKAIARKIRERWGQDQ